jgi:MoaA/NifB/PqqE/SkfB family radical SAM enzyme
MREKTLFILPTAYCTLNCDHCAISSGPNKSTDSLSISKINEVLEKSKQIGFGDVHISGGGEPLTLSDVYIKGLLHTISNYGYFINLTTNGFWATTKTKALEKMKFLSENGLNQIIVSLSESHLKFIPFNNILNICENNKKTDIQVVVYITENNERTRLFESFLSLFKENNLPPPFVINGNYMIPLGRAEESYNAGEFYFRDVSSFDVGCQSICNNICIHPNGSVTPCAMVAALEIKGFNFGNIHAQDFLSIYNNICKSKLCLFIREKGVVRLKELIESKSSKIFNQKYVNMCHLCYSINSSFSDLAEIESFILANDNSLK